MMKYMPSESKVLSDAVAIAQEEFMDPSWSAEHGIVVWVSNSGEVVC